MIGDVNTVIWKEWRELRGHTQTASQKAAVGLAVAVVIGVSVALTASIGPEIFSTFVPTVFAIAPTMGIIASVCDSFAGERERHTLETLLASRVTDEALLIGKMLAFVLYGWSGSILLTLVLIAGANLHNRNWPPLLPSAANLLVVFAIAPLLMLFFAAAGVLCSLRAATVKEAQTRLVLLFVALFMGLAIGINVARAFLPAYLLGRSAAFATANAGVTIVITMATFLGAVDLVIVLIAYALFRRGRLMLYR